MGPGCVRAAVTPGAAASLRLPAELWNTGLNFTSLHFSFLLFPAHIAHPRAPRLQAGSHLMSQRHTRAHSTTRTHTQTHRQRRDRAAHPPGSAQTGTRLTAAQTHGTFFFSFIFLPFFFFLHNPTNTHGHTGIDTAQHTNRGPHALFYSRRLHLWDGTGSGGGLRGVDTENWSEQPSRQYEHSNQKPLKRNAANHCGLGEAGRLVAEAFERWEGRRLNCEHSSVLSGLCVRPQWLKSEDSLNWILPTSFPAKALSELVEVFQAEAETRYLSPSRPWHFVRHI